MSGGGHRGQYIIEGSDYFKYCVPRTRPLLTLQEVKEIRPLNVGLNSTGFSEYMRTPHAKFVTLVEQIASFVMKQETCMRKSKDPSEGLSRVALVKKILPHRVNSCGGDMSLQHVRETCPRHIFLCVRLL